jgi:FADH2 O2-dependent halogenase
MSQKDTYDVVILGSGIAGSMIGAILARHGLSVLLVDGVAHPRFAVGESTVGHTSAMIELIANRYDVPEIAYLSSHRRIREHVSAACGVKRAFGFVYHREDGSQHPEEANQFVIPPLMHGLESHLFRQDIDAFMFQTACKYGADFVLNAHVDDVLIDDDGAVVKMKGQRDVRCRYVCDGSGFRSVLAGKYGLRAGPNALESRTRSIFTHMVEVKSYDSCIPKNYHRVPVPWFQTTLHHCFDGGWLWVIPFNNTRNPVNALCSVGVTIDCERFKKDGRDPEEEFFEFANRYPSVRDQFANARKVRPWVSTDRLQYTSTKTVGNRWCLLVHAAGFIDPLFSRGLALTMDSIFFLADRILNAFRTDNFDEQEFAFIDALSLGGVKYHDQLVATSYSSWKDYRLWNAWIRIWALGEAGLDQLRILKAHLEFAKYKDPKALHKLEEVIHPGLLCPDSVQYEELFRNSRQLVAEATAGKISAEDASNAIFKKIRDAELFSPNVGLAAPEVRVFGHSQKDSIRAFYWGRYKAQAHVRKYYDLEAIEVFKLMGRNFREMFDPQLKLSAQQLSQ